MGWLFLFGFFGGGRKMKKLIVLLVVGVVVWGNVALATIDDGIRYILYDPEFLNNVKEIVNSKVQSSKHNLFLKSNLKN